MTTRHRAIDKQVRWYLKNDSTGLRNNLDQLPSQPVEDYKQAGQFQTTNGGDILCWVKSYCILSICDNVDRLSDGPMGQLIERSTCKQLRRRIKIYTISQNLISQRGIHHVKTIGQAWFIHTAGSPCYRCAKRYCRLHWPELSDTMAMEPFGYRDSEYYSNDILPYS